MKPTLSRTLLILSFTAVTILVAFLMAPYVLDAYIFPPLLKKIPLQHKTLSISRLTPFSIQGRLLLENDDNPVVSIPRFELSYTPVSLFKRQAVSLMLDHAAIRLRKEAGSITLAGLYPGTPPENMPSDGLALVLPFQLADLTLKQCSIVLEQQNQPDLKLTVTSHATLRFAQGAQNDYRLESLEGSFELADALSTTGNFSMVAGSGDYNASLELQSLVLPGLSLLSPELVAMASSPLTMRASFTVDHKTLALDNIDATGSISRFQPIFGPVRLQGTAADMAVEFSFTGSPDKLSYKITELRSDSPFSTQIVMSGAASLLPGNLSTAGHITARVGTEILQAGNPPVVFDVDFDASYSPDSGWNIELDGHHESTEPLTLSANSLSVVVPEIDFTGTLRRSSDEISAQLSCSGAPFTLSADNTEVALAKTHASMQFSRRNSKISTRLTGMITEVAVPAKKLRAQDIRFALPADFPFNSESGGESGSLSVASIGLNKKDLVSLSSTIAQRGDTFNLKGTLNALFNPNLVLAFTGSADPTAGYAELSWNIDNTIITSFSVPREINPAPDMSFDGVLAAYGRLRLEKNRISGSAQTTISEATLNIPDADLVAKEINCALELPELPQLASSPSQFCSVGKIDAGKLAFSDLGITFRIEDPQTLFIEKSTVTWCQGTLESGSLRLSASDREVDTTFFCSRINFAELLNQFGLDQTEGQGALNGKLPIKLSREGLHFDDGFLFSTPGTGGIVRFSNTDMLRQGMGSAAEAGYLNYSMEALENFAYDWTKLSFKTTGDQLLLAMELEGKPRTPLPYGFSDGMIVATDEGNGLQYPIKLDVNFRLPLATLFKVGQNIKSMMEKR